MKLIFRLFAAFMLTGTINAQMVLEYNVLSQSGEVILPLEGTVNVNVDWGDGSSAAFNTAGVKRHSYATTGMKTVTITGTLTAFGNEFEMSRNLIRVLSWDGLGLENLSYAFYNSDFLVELPTSLPSTITNMKAMLLEASSFNQSLNTWNTENVTNMSQMFMEANSFNQSIGNWNTGAVTDMSYMFYHAHAFNQPINTWNTGSVTTMKYMFHDADNFNQPLGNWNTENVTNMSDMFEGALQFNQSLGSWNTSNVTDMSGMFVYAQAFNQPLDTWNTVNVTNMESMFSNTNNFDQPLGNWNTSKVTNMGYMFALAKAFNQPIGSWDVTHVTNMYNMFGLTSLCTDNYDNLLNGWAPQAVNTGITFTGGSSKYSSAGAASRSLLVNKGWSVSDAGMGTTSSSKCLTTDIENESASARETVIYPNPAKEKLTIQLNFTINDQITYSIFNSIGTLVLEKEIPKNSLGIEIETDVLPLGTYLIKIQSQENVTVRSFVKE